MSAPHREIQEKQSGSSEWVLAAGVSLLAALAVVSPFFFLGTASGHDVAFHMASWLDAAGQWKQGVVLPRWAEWPNYGFGEPRFVFYPPISWLFGALLGSLIPWTAVAAVFVICAQAVAGISAYALLRRLCDSRAARLLGAAVFAANPYALLIVYMRSDFAEQLAVAIFPLLVLAALNLAGAAKDGSGAAGARAVPFAISFCAVWLMNAPAAVIATYSMTLLFAVAAWQARSLRVALRGAVGMALGFGLAGFYLVPAIYEQRWVNIAGALAGGLAPSDNFLYAKTSDAEHDAFNRIASHVAVLLVLWLAAAAIGAAVKIRRGEGAANRKSVAVFAALGGAATLLMLRATTLLWSYLPELRFVQFPWRWMSIVAVSGIALMGMSVRGKMKWVWAALAALAIAGTGRYLVKHAWWDTEDMPTLQAALESGAGFEGTDEYDPVGDDHTDLPQNEPRARVVAAGNQSGTPEGAELFVDEWSAERRTLRVVGKEPTRVAVRLVDYPAWRIEVNGRTVRAEHLGETRQIVVPVAGGESKIQIVFTRTMDRVLGGWLSAISGALLMFARIWERRKRRAAA